MLIADCERANASNYRSVPETPRRAMMQLWDFLARLSPLTRKSLLSELERLPLLRFGLRTHKDYFAGGAE